jgi:hypothetical protein
LLLAGLLDLVVLDLELLAAAADETLDVATGLLDELVDAGLVELVGRDRWRLHDLVRLYARRAAYDELTEEERQAAIARALEVEAARAREMLELASARDAIAAERLRVWLEVDRPNLAGLLEQATETGLLGLADELASWIEILLEALTSWPDRIRVDRARLEVARQANDAWLEAWVLHGIGVTHARAGHHAQAAALFQQSLALAVRSGDSRLEGEIGRDLSALPTWRDDPAGVALGRPMPMVSPGVGTPPTVATAAVSGSAPTTARSRTVPPDAPEAEVPPGPGPGPTPGNRPGSGGGPGPSPGPGPSKPSGSGRGTDSESPGRLARARRAVAAARGSGAAPQAPLVFGERLWPRS